MTKEQLGDLVLSNEKQLYAIAKTILWREVDVEDAVQEAIVKAFSCIHTLKKDKYALTWLIRILINECYDQIRRQNKIIFLEDSMEAQLTPAEVGPEYYDLYQALSELSEELRLPIVLYYFGGFLTREIAEIMDISEGAVRKRLVRARKILNEKLSQEEFIS